jgi:hypothetical protein
MLLETLSKRWPGERQSDFQKVWEAVLPRVRLTSSTQTDWATKLARAVM